VYALLAASLVKVAKELDTVPQNIREMLVARVGENSELVLGARV
jgi:hypothetical protein